MAVWPTITDGVTRLGNALFTSIKAYIDDLVGGQGLPVGGATNDLLTKTSATDYAVAWTDAPTVDSVTLDTAAAEATGIAKIFWDATEGTVAFGMAGGVVTQEVGRNAFVRAKNVTASQINRGQVVYLTGAQGDRPTIELADATDESTSADTIGIAAEDIAVSAEGEVCISGILANVNTYGLTAGVMTYLSETAGAWTQTRPTQPAHGVRLGIPLKISNSPSGNSGVFFVQINNGYEFEELHDVLITTATAGDIIKRNAGNTLWVNTAPAALTKTDDTNVTLTLGGSASTALVNAASLTLGWTGQLAVGRGGTGASTLTGYVYGNGASAMTASTTIPGSAITGDISGNAGTATTLQTARTLWGNSFNGSANVDGAITITAALGTGSEAFAIKNTTAGAVGNTARMNFYLNNTTDAAAVNTARIEAVSTSASNRNTDLVFYTAQNLVAPAEQMRLTRDGRLGVGVTPISTAAVDIGTGFTAALALRVTSGGNGIFAFYDSAGTTNYGRILWSAAQVQLNAISNIPLTFFTNNTERLRITNTGNVHPGSNAGGSLGILNTAWSSLFLSSGAVVNFNAGDVTITHAADALTFAGATNGYTFSGGNIIGTLQGNATNVTGTVAIANGGTGAVTAQAAINALAGAVTSGSYLRGNGTNVVMSTIQAGDVPTLNQNTTGSAATLTTARTLTIGNTGKTFNGSANVSWTLAELGAVPTAGGVNMSGSFGLNDQKLYLRTNGDTNHYLWNADDDWEELVAYSGTGFRVKASTGATLLTVSTSQISASVNISGGKIFSSDWFRNTGATGLYNETYARGIWEIQASLGGGTGGYGNYITYGTGLNNWHGWGVETSGARSYLMFTGAFGGIYSQNGIGWGWYYNATNNNIGYGSSNTNASYSHTFNGATLITSNLYVNGSITATSTKSFEITHPVDSTKKLRYAALESPRLDLLHRGRVVITGTTAAVNIDTALDLLPGTFLALCRDAQCVVANNQTFTAVRGWVDGATLHIEAAAPLADVTVDWLIVAERKDSDVMTMEFTDDTGRLVNEYEEGPLTLDPGPAMAVPPAKPYVAPKKEKKRRVR